VSDSFNVWSLRRLRVLGSANKREFRSKFAVGDSLAEAILLNGFDYVILNSWREKS
jgi:hypothetical protein